MSLDSLAGLTRGGDSLLPLQSGDLDSNELYRRLTVADPAQRMPFGRLPLSDADLALVRTWIERGAPSGRPLRLATSFSWRKWLTGDLEPRDKLARVFPLYRIALLASAGWLLVVLGRLRAVSRSSQRGIRVARLPSGLAAVRGPDLILCLLAIWLASATASLLLSHHRHTELVTELETEIEQLSGLPSFGDPPIPSRLYQPKKLHATYYRGNNERSPLLFNNGVYQTAVLSMDLTDADGNDVHYGDQLTRFPLSVKLTIQRSPNTATRLFGEFQMSQVSLSQEPSGLNLANDQQRIRLTTLQPGEHWSATYPLPDNPSHRSPNARRFEGMIYVYYASRQHLGISYTIVFDEQMRVLSQSDIWMGNLLFLSNLIHPQPGQIAPSEWLDYRPLPIIPDADSRTTELDPHRGRSPADNTPSNL